MKQKNWFEALQKEMDSIEPKDIIEPRDEKVSPREEYLGQMDENEMKLYTIWDRLQEQLQIYNLKLQEMEEGEEESEKRDELKDKIIIADRKGGAVKTEIFSFITERLGLWSYQKSLAVKKGFRIVGFDAEDRRHGIKSLLGDLGGIIVVTGHSSNFPFNPSYPDKHTH